MNGKRICSTVLRSGIYGFFPLVLDYVQRLIDFEKVFQEDEIV